MPTRRLMIPLGAAAAIGLALGGGLARSQESPADATPATTGVANTATTGTSALEPSTEERMKQARRAALAGQPGAVPDDEDKLEPPSDAEWEAASKAMQELTPYWWGRFGRLAQEGPGRERMQRSIVTRHRELERIRKRDPEQHQREVEQLRLEDEVLSIGRRLWRDPQRDDAQERKRQLREAVGKLVDLRIRNREARIARVAATLEKERERLKADKQNRDAMAERQYEAVLNRRPNQGLPGPGGSPPGGRRGPGGPGGPSGPGGPPERPGFASPPPPGFPGAPGDRPRPRDGRPRDEAPAPAPQE